MTTVFRSKLTPALFALCLGTSLASTPVSAFEPTGNEIADAFLTLLEAEDGTVKSYGGVSASGSTVTISDIRLADENGDDLTIDIASSVLNDGTLHESGRLKLGDMSLTDLSLKADDGALSIGSFAATNLVLPAPSELNSTSENSIVGPSYSTLELQNTVMSDEDGNQVEIARFFTAIDAMDGDLPTESRFAIDGLTIDGANLDADGKKALSDLGYDKITIDAEGQGSWKPEEQTVVVRDFKISGKDAGTITLNFSLGGVSRDLIMKLNETDGEPEQALGLIQGVTVNDLILKLDNSSLVERLLDLQAKEAGTDRATLVSQLSSGLPMMVTVLQNQALQDKVSNALTSFLQSPVSLEVKAMPANPVPVAQIMGAAMMAPQSLPEVLGLDIFANGAN